LQRKNITHTPDPLCPDCVEKGSDGFLNKTGTASAPGQTTFIAAFSFATITQKRAKIKNALIKR